MRALLSFVMCCALMGVLCGVVAACKTAPTPTQAIGIDAGVQAAVAIAVQNGTSDPAVWAKRARLILSVIEQVRPLASGEAVSVPALAAAVGPVLDKAKLQPAERIAANGLVSALALVIDANVNPSNPTAVTVVAALDSAAKAASVYAALAPPAPPTTIF